MKVTMELNKVLIEQSDLSYKYLARFFGKDFHEFIYFVTDGSFCS